MSGEPRRRLADNAGPVMVALVGVALVAASAVFVFGWQRALHGGAVPKLLGLLALVLVARRLRAGRPRALLDDGPAGPSPGQRLGGLVEAALVLAAVSAFLREGWRIAGSLARPWP